MGKRKRIMDLYYPRRRKVKQKEVPTCVIQETLQETLVRDFLKRTKIKTKSTKSTNCTCSSVDKVLEFLPIKNKMRKRKRIKDLYYPRRRKVKRKGVTCIIQETIPIPCTCNSFDSGLELLPKYEVLQKFGKLQKDKAQ